MRIFSINIGRPQLLVAPGGQPYSTAINKKPVAGPVELGENGAIGDFQADPSVHGGPDKALCVYPHEHYPFFSERLGVELAVPSYGENLTTEGLLEDEVRIGDTFAAGGRDGVVLQVSQPREPCVKLARKHKSRELGGWIHDTGYSGFYVRVLQPGTVRAGDELVRTARGPEGATVFEVLKAMYRPGVAADHVAAMSRLDALSPGWRERLAKRADEERQGSLPFVDADDE